MSALLGRQIPKRNEIIINHNTQYFRRIISYVKYMARMTFESCNQRNYFTPYEFNMTVNKKVGRTIYPQIQTQKP